MQAQTYPHIATLDVSMRNIAAVCDMHRVPSGVPEDLPNFLLLLQSKKDLAVRFWELVGGLYAGGLEVGPLTPAAEAVLQAHTLEAIVRVVAGAGVSEMMASGGASRQAVEEMADLLRGVGSGPIVVPRRPVAHVNAESRDQAYVKARVDANRGSHSGTRTFFADDDAPWVRRMGVAELRQELLQGEYSNRFDSPVSQSSGLRRWFDGLSAANARVRTRVVGSAVAFLVIGGTILHAQHTGSLQRYEGLLRDFVIGTSDSEQHISSRTEDVPVHLQTAKATPLAKSKVRKAGSSRLKSASAQDGTNAAEMMNQNSAGDKSE